MIARAVVINLDTRADRMARFNSMLARVGWPFAAPERFSAVDAGRCAVPEDWGWPSGAWGCMQSHRMVLERAIVEKSEPLLVLEDDVYFLEGFGAHFSEFMQKVPDDWQQIMLGGQFVQRGPRPAIRETVAPGVLRVSNCERTHAYLIRGPFLRALYSKFVKSCGHCDHAMGPMQHDFQTYAPDPFLAGQVEGLSDISGSTNPTRLWVEPNPERKVHWFRSLPELETVRGKGLHGGNQRENGIDVGLEAIMQTGVTNAKLREWEEMIAWEGRSMTPECEPAFYHPVLTEAHLREAFGERLVLH